MTLKEHRSVRIGKNGWISKRIMGMNLTIRCIQTYDLVINLVDLAQGRDMTFRFVAYDISLDGHYP